VRIVLAGASGFLGAALRRQLIEDGHTVVRLVRSGAALRSDEQLWDPYQGQLPAGVLSDVDAVVNLAGAPIAHWPWTSSYRRTLLDSRVATTRTIATALSRLDETSPALVNASAVGLYGKDRGEERLTEDSARGEGYLADVVEQWEAATRPASASGVRVVLLRTAVVLDKDGGALHAMARPFKLGVGGTLGSGRQWFPSISLADYVGAATRAIVDNRMAGAYNVVAPEPATNADLTRLLGEILHRPAMLRVPAFALRAILGELSAELLGSLKVVPQRLLDAGFEFSHPDLASQLHSALA
jgi:hypothetical protein